MRLRHRRKAQDHPNFGGLKTSERLENLQVRVKHHTAIENQAAVLLHNSFEALLLNTKTKLPNSPAIPLWAKYKIISNNLVRLQRVSGSTIHKVDKEPFRQGVN